MPFLTHLRQPIYRFAPKVWLPRVKRGTCVLASPFILSHNEDSFALEWISNFWIVCDDLYAIAKGLNLLQHCSSEQLAAKQAIKVTLGL